MIDEEDIKRQLNYISQEAWRIEGNTTINKMIEYIVREALFVVVKSIDEELKSKLSEIENIKSLVHNSILEQRQWMTDTAITLFKNTPKKGKANAS